VPFKATVVLTGTKLFQSASVGQPSFSEEFGRDSAPSGTLSLANGTGNNCANVIYRGNDSGMLVVPAGGNLTISLKGTGGEVDSLNKSLNLATVKAFYFELATPGSGNFVGVGPNGNSLCANLGFNSCGSVQVGNHLLLTNGETGWTIAASNANLTFRNPGGTNQVIRPRIVGVGA
jgi:hypothetical protein